MSATPDRQGGAQPLQQLQEPFSGAEPPQTPANGANGSHAPTFEQRMVAAAASSSEAPEPKRAPRPKAKRAPNFRDKHNKRVASGKRVVDPGRESDECASDDKPKGWLVKANDLEDENIDWLWRHRLAKGALHLIAGTAGTGKSTLAFALAAIISSGGMWPDGTQAKAGRVVIWSGEDSYSTTIKPRLRAAGANLDNILFLAGHKATGKGKGTTFDPAEHMEMLVQDLKAAGDVAMVIVDPIVSAIKGDSHKNAEVRRDLQPLVDLLEEAGIVGLAITHYTKGTQGRHVVERVTGSLAFAAIARMIFATVAVQGEVGKYRLVVGKTNIAPLGGGFEYSIRPVEVQAGEKLIETTRIDWGEALEGEPMQLIADAEGSRSGRPSKQGSAHALLAALLANGPCKVSVIQAACEKANISIDTLRRAAKVAGCRFERSVPGNNRSEWQWVMTPQGNEVHTP